MTTKQALKKLLSEDFSGSKLNKMNISQMRDCITNVVVQLDKDENPKVLKEAAEKKNKMDIVMHLSEAFLESEHLGANLD